MQPAAVHLLALGGERLGDVQRGDGAEQLVLLAHLALDDDLHRADLLGRLLGSALQLGVARGDDGLLVLQLADVLLVGEHRLLAGQQEVAAEAVLDRDQLTGLAEAVDVLTKNDLHVLSPKSRTGLADHRVVGEERQATGALDGDRHLALVLGAVAGDPAGNDLAALGDEVLQRGLILEVHLGVLLGAEAADLLAAKAASAPLVIVHAAIATAIAPVTTAETAAVAAPVTTAETAAVAAPVTTAETAAPATAARPAAARARSRRRLVIRTVHECSRSRKGPWKAKGRLSLLGRLLFGVGGLFGRLSAEGLTLGDTRAGLLDVSGQLHILEHRTGLGVHLVRQLHGQVAGDLVDVAQVALHLGHQLRVTQEVGVHVDGAGLLGDGVQGLLLAPHREADQLAALAVDDATDALLEPVHVVVGEVGLDQEDGLVLTKPLGGRRFSHVFSPLGVECPPANPGSGETVSGPGRPAAGDGNCSRPSPSRSSRANTGR
ncbi:hypothetical protein STIAU_0974 [Stigmatella aurantiaca DW4/3-1]|uniref:Uncharacterized protein n=1 Tax=Stigmatella aurantiaca (strain DW4/3-1) TaxID=378806 RepID=Q08SF7_STIAD|nr:hypothetical protein STIAU_0974 [Stigmatella aurantiaca DW4/3-1]